MKGGATRRIWQFGGGTGVRMTFAFLRSVHRAPTAIQFKKSLR